MKYKELRDKYKAYTIYTPVRHKSLGSCLITGIAHESTPVLLVGENGDRQDSELWIYIGPNRGDYTGACFMCPIEDVELIED